MILQLVQSIMILPCIVGILGIEDTTYTKPDGNQIRNVVGGSTETINVFFGTSGIDSPAGTAEEDRLYTMAGDDTLTGLAGDDHLEGGPGNDTLKGGEDNDTLLGGKGDDTLEGQEGNDILDGGDDNDTYVFTKDSGHDQIFNFEDNVSDDTGVIKYEDQVVDGAGSKRKSVNANIYYDEDKEIRYSLIDEILTIQFEQDSVLQASVTIPKFVNGNLGINLPTDIDELEDTTARTFLVSAKFTGDCAADAPDPGVMVSLYSWMDNPVMGDLCSGVRETINEPQLITNDTAYSGFILASGEDDRIIGNDEKEWIHGSLGSDYIKANGGDDFINGDLSVFNLGIFLFTPAGEQGQDWIEAGAGDDMVIGDVVHTHIPDIGDNAPEYDYGNEDFQASQDFYIPEIQNDTIFGGPGNDQLFGNLGDDFISGGIGDDIIYGGAHSDKIEAGDGDDVVFGDVDLLVWYFEGQGTSHVDEIKQAGGDDFVSGGNGNDKIYTGTGDDTIYGGEGDDTIVADGTYDPVAEVINAEDDIRYNGKDLVFGGGGADEIFGYGNNDILHGDDGNDIIDGDHDTLSEEFHGDDILYGGKGDDQLDGQGGNDELYGGDGIDLIIGGKGDDYLEGGDGDDQLQGKEDDDKLFGGTGADVLFGDEGNDYLDGGSGEDELVGGDGDDIIVGGADLDYLYGGEGDDRLAGGSGDDVLQADAGNDYLAGGRGSDTLRGGAGNDTYIANVGDGVSGIDDSSGANQISFGAGISFASISVVTNDSGVFLDYGTGDTVFIERASMGGAWSVSFANGSSVSLSYLIQDHTPQSTTTTRVTLAEGVTAEDLSYARSNNSLIINYVLINGDGNSINGDPNSSTTTENNTPLDSWIDPALLSDAGTIFSLQNVTIEGQEYSQLSLTNWFNADAANYLNSLQLTNEIVDLTQLGNVASTYTGSSFADEITASDGDDTVLALSGNDQIEALAGNDEITAGKGQDQIAGGMGNDRYYFAVDDGQDIIFDESGTDRIIFGEGINASHLTVEEKRNGLLIRIETLDAEGAAVKDGIFVVGWFQDDNFKIETFEFHGGSSMTFSDIEQSITGNRSPIANASIDNQMAVLGQAFSYSLPANLFSDPDPSDILKVRAFAAEGGELNGWLQFDLNSQTFSGTPDINDTATVSILVVAADPQGYTKAIVFEVAVDSTNGLPGTVGDDELIGSSNNDFLSGLEGADTLSGLSGNDRLIGGAGDDILRGGYGDDTFVFNSGDGVDIIRTPTDDNFQFTETDSIMFGDSILPEDVRLIRDPEVSTSLLITYSGLGDKIIVEHFFSPTELRHPIDFIIFSNGVVWDSEEMRERVEHIIDDMDNAIYVVKDQDVIHALDGNDILAGGIGNDQLYGNNGNDSLSGRSGDDQLNGNSGNDILSGQLGDDQLVGGLGQDILNGGGGDNRLLFSADHGTDSISLTDPGATDTIVFDDSILLGDLSYYRFGDALVIGTDNWSAGLSDTDMPSLVDDFIIGENFYGYYGISTEVNNRIGIELADTTIIDLTGISLNGAYLDLKNRTTIDGYLSQFNTQYGGIRTNANAGFDYSFIGTNDDDIILGSDTKDYVTPLNGSDLVYTGAGDDEIRLGTSGTKYIFAEAGNDVIVDWFGSGIHHISGGTGDDVFSIEKNTYLHFVEGDGIDIVNGYNYGSENLHFVFEGGLIETDFNFSIEGDQTDLIPQWGSSGDQITFVNWLDLTDTSLDLTKAMEIHFSNTIWTQSEVKNQILSSVNFAPIANNDAGFSTEENTLLTISASDLIANDTDLNDDVLTIINVFGAQFGAAIFDSEADTIAFTPAVGYSGSAQFSYTVTDGEFESQSTVDITVNSASNDGGSGGSSGPAPDPANYDNVLDGTEVGEQLFYSNQNDYISGLGGDDQLFGLGGNDYLNGGDGNDYLDGGDGDDIQIGGAGDDQLGGDAGNDLLIGGSGNDVYVFRPGSGQDTIDNSIGDAGVDYLIFTDDLTSDRLVYTRVGDDLVITILDSDDQVTILNWFLGDIYQIDYIQPAGSSGIPAGAIESMLTDPSTGGGSGGGDNNEPPAGVWEEPLQSNYNNLVTGTENAEQLYFGHDSDFLDALGGDDQLFGLNGNDYLSGGAGNDYLNGGNDSDIQFGGDGDDQLGGDPGDDLLLGGGGNDIYVYGAGDGSDVIDNSIGDNGTDWLIFTDDLTADRLIYSQVGNDLVITVTNSADQITILNWFVGSEYQVDYIQPSGGSGIPASQINLLVN